MNTKTILIIALAGALGAGAMWVSQRHLQAAAVSDRKVLYYTCPMRPSVRSGKPGNCPECGMTLQPVYADATGTNAAPLLSSGCCSF